MLNPEILLLDEPNEGIQPNIVKEISEVIRRLNREQGITISTRKCQTWREDWIGNSCNGV